MKLSHRLLLLVGSALLPISLFLVHTALFMERHQVEQAYAEARRLLLMIEDEQLGVVPGVRQTLSTLRQTEAVRNGSQPACQELLDRLAPDLPPYLAVHVTDIAGTIRCASERGAAGTNISDRVPVQAALDGDDFVVGGHISARIAKDGALPFAMPYRGSNGKVGGVVTALLDIDWLEAYLEKKPLPPNATLLIADRDGIQLARKPAIPGIAGTPLPDRFMDLLHRPAGGTVEMVGLDGVERLSVYSPLGAGLDDLFLCVGIDKAAALASARLAWSQALALLVIIGAGTAVSLVWIGRRYLQNPVALLADTARRWHDGDRSARAVVPRGAVEFQALATDFNVMADAVEAREQALQASEARHRVVFETAVDAMVVIDEAGIIQDANSATARTFGYAAAEMTGRNVAMLMHDEHRIQHDGYIGNYLRTGERRIIGIGREVEGRRRDGSSFPLELSIAEWRDQAGKRFFTGIMRDISVRRRGEQALNAERERLRRVVEGAPFPVIVHAENGEVLHISRAWLDISGYSKEQLANIGDWTLHAYGQRAEDINAGIDRLYELDRPVDEGEYEIRTAGGNTRLWAFRSAPVGLDAAGRRLVVSMAADITDRRDSEERLRLLMREVDHRAKNALAVVQSIVQLSRAEDPADFSEAVQGRIQAMARAHSLLAASRWSGADLASLLRDELSAYADEANVELGGPSIALRPESAQAISLALHELATNAAKYGALSRRDGRLRVSWAPEAEGAVLCIEWVEHGGPSLAGPPIRHGFGTLMLSEVITTQLGGKLTLDWRPEGLYARLCVPSDSWQANGISGIAESGLVKPLPAVPFGDGRVLVVEDEALTAMALQTLLEDAGYLVLGPAARVEDALDLLRSGRPDAAVLDVNLFGATVDPVAVMLEDMGVPYLFCTGYQSGGATGMNYPQAPVLTKPVNAVHLLAAVNDMVSTGGRAGSGAAPAA